MNATVDDVFVFDTGPLSHFALAGWLGALKAVVAGRSALIPDVVADELRTGADRDNRISAVLLSSWIEVRELQTDDARKAADSNHVERRGTLGLMIEAIRAELLTVKLVSAIADDLLATEYHLPFKRGRFEQWAVEHGGLSSCGRGRRGAGCGCRR